MRARLRVQRLTPVDKPEERSNIVIVLRFPFLAMNETQKKQSKEEEKARKAALRRTSRKKKAAEEQAKKGYETVLESILPKRKYQRRLGNDDKVSSFTTHLENHKANKP